MNNYIWTSGARIDADAEQVGQRFDYLQRVNGQHLTARVVLDDARPTDSPLHDCFEWDDIRAGELYRESQARYLLRSIRIVQERAADGQPTRTVHAFVNLPEAVGDEEERHYIPIARVMNDRELFQKACEQAARELSAFESKYAQFSGLVSAVREAREHILSLEFDAPTAA